MIVNGFKFGCFIHHEFGSGYLATIMEPTCNLDSLPFLIVKWISWQGMQRLSVKTLYSVARDGLWLKLLAVLNHGHGPAKLINHLWWTNGRYLVFQIQSGWYVSLPGTAHFQERAWLSKSFHFQVGRVDWLEDVRQSGCKIDHWTSQLDSLSSLEITAIFLNQFFMSLSSRKCEQSVSFAFFPGTKAIGDYND